MSVENDKFKNLCSFLEETIGSISEITEECPGCYHTSINCDGSLIAKEFYIVDVGSSAISSAAKAYGESVQEAPGWLLYPYTDESGWHIVQYEITRYKARLGLESVEDLRGLAVCSRELYPEYFGVYAVPRACPWGKVLRNRELAEGVYWLETDEFKEVLFVDAMNIDDLSSYARSLAEKEAGPASTGDLYFSMQNACVPLFELYLQLKPGTVDKAALMNAIMRVHPVYALKNNIRGQLEGLDNLISLSDEGKTDYLRF